MFTGLYKLCFVDMMKISSGEEGHGGGLDGENLIS